MKRTLYSLILSALLLLLVLPQWVFANMAAPEIPDVGSAVTFEKNDTIAVLSETLNITVRGSSAHIEATYTMKNTSDAEITTPSMFLSPNIESAGTSVTVNGKTTAYTHESYALYYDCQVETDDWQYIVADSETAYSPENRTVDAITFEMTFAPLQQYDVTVSYTYVLGGRPNLNSDQKYGEIEYLLTPAAMWKDFGQLTINVCLDDELPVLKESNLAFRQTDKRTYVYTSDSLPDENLYIRIDQNNWQEFTGLFHNPYFIATAVAVLVVLLAVAVVLIVIIMSVIVIIMSVRKFTRRKKQ